jgi:acetyl esterase/lipase
MNQSLLFSFIRNFSKPFICGALAYCGVLHLTAADLPAERSLWKGVPGGNAIQFDKESVRSHKVSVHSLSGSNQVFSQVFESSYTIHQAPETIATGVGIVICPGGGYRDVWLDREGHDLGIWLQKQGITSLVLKYRTNYGAEQSKPKYPWPEYLTAVVADARQGIQILRNEATSLNLDPKKIGIGGFSAGGHLALSVALGLYADSGSNTALSDPNFAGLFYPWLRDDLTSEGVVEKHDHLPPMFFMNALNDRLTPANRCIEFFTRIHSKGAPSELHIYSKGGHGFDMGEGKGASAPLWKKSFLAWLTDTGFIERQVED